MMIKFSHAELTDLARGTLLARGFSAADAARFTARIICNHKTKPATVTLVLEECSVCHPEPVESRVGRDAADVCGKSLPVVAVATFHDGTKQQIRGAPCQHH